MSLYKKLILSIKSGGDRALLLKKNIFQIFIYRTINVFVSFLIVPITINYLNSYDYGIWLTISSFMVWIELMDLGIANGLRNKLTESIALGNKKLSKEYVSSAYFFLTIIACLIFLTFLLISVFVDWGKMLNINGNSNIQLIFVVVIFFFSLRFIFKTIGTILIADHKPNIDALLSALGSLLSLLIVFILTKFTEGSLLVVSIVLSSIPLLIYLLASVRIFKSNYEFMSPSFSNIKKDLIKILLALGSRFFIIQISCLLIYSSINMLIIRWFGADAVTQYNIAYKYFYTIILAFTIIVTPLWSAFTDAFVRGDLDWIKRVVQKVQLIAVFFIAISFFLVLIADQFYDLWVGDLIDVPFSMTIAVFVYVIIYILLSTYNYVINGSGKVYLQTIISFFTLILFIPTAYVLSFYLNLGSIGVIYASSLMQLPLLVAAYVQYKKLVNKKLTGIWGK